MDLSSANTAFVLDSWPIVEKLRRGHESDILRILLERAANREVTLFISEMNWGEILYLLAKEIGIARADSALADLEHALITVIPIQPGDALRAARLKSRFSISYADCFCALLAQEYQAPIVTGDTDFLAIRQKLSLDIIWVGR